MSGYKENLRSTSRKDKVTHPFNGEIRAKRTQNQDNDAAVSKKKKTFKKVCLSFWGVAKFQNYIH